MHWFWQFSMINKNNRRYNTRKKTTAQRLMSIVKILSILIVVGLIPWGIEKIKDMDSLKATLKWQINSGLITQAQLEKDIQPLIKDSLLLDLIEIKQVLESQPWVAKADIKRSFFNTIQINIKTHKVAMRWENTDCKTNNTSPCSGYISHAGVLFFPKKKIESNAVLARSKADKIIVTQLYQDYQNYQKILTKMRIKSFSKTHIDQLVLEPNIKVVLGYQQRQQRLVRFLQAYKTLRKKISKHQLNQATFDMRYSKGFSLKL
ncbi:MAG: FtsQ-type POTRA domain-containing protein [Gammaproteobacteria bacterium]|nr:FtsQ-type POTRA domain-containing protein [Gammaproteobacteria bacterium]